MTRANPTWVICVGLVCLAWVLSVVLRQPDPAPLTVTVTVTRAQDVQPTMRALGLPALEVRR